MCGGKPGVSRRSGRSCFGRSHSASVSVAESVALWKAENWSVWCCTFRLFSIFYRIMKTILALLVSLLAFGSVAFCADAPAKRGKLNHVVALKFKESASREQIQAVEQAFRH